MHKILWLFLSFAVVMVEARENPFEITMSPDVVGKTTQIKDERSDFNSTVLNFPSSARILKTITLTYQNIDGSISEDIAVIDQNVDWHSPLLLSSQKVATNGATTTPITQTESKKVPEKKVEVSTKESKEVVKNLEGNSFKLMDGISFFINQNEITIFTKDAKIRDFLIADPYKIVIDFKKDNAYATKTLEFQKAPFVSATVGNHEGFYRIAILLDGHYRYDLQPFNGGYIIKLK